MNWLTSLQALLLNPFVQSALKVFVFITLMVIPLAAVLTLLERRWSALIQDRIGPNRANLGRLRLLGLFHIVADGIKSIFKEDFIADNTDKFLYTIAPVFGFVASFAVFSVIPIAGPIGNFRFQLADFEVGMLMVFAFTSLAVYGTVLAGWSTNNKFGLLGSVRGSAQMISYEVFLGSSLVGLFMVYGSLRISDIVAGQNEYWFGGWWPKWGIFTQPLAFFLFFTALIAETKRTPFDAPEGESEISTGYLIEYSGMRLASFLLSEYISLVAVACLMTTLFLGSYHVPFLHADGFHFGSLWHWQLPAAVVFLLQFASFFAKVLFFCWLQLMLRWSLPRFRFDQTMDIGWKKLLPLSLLNTLITLVVLLWLEQ